MNKKEAKKRGRPELPEKSRILSVRVPETKYDHYKSVFRMLVDTDKKISVTK